MTHLRSFIIILCLAATALVYGLSGESHNFTEGKCTLCHVDPKDSPMSIRPTVTLACKACHLSLGKNKSHPCDVYPRMSIPSDLPLTEGKLTCLTCHFVHIKEGAQFFSERHYFLRRQVKGIFFCTICHAIDRNRHIVYENVHTGTYTETDSSMRIDRVSLECIECHDSHIQAPVSSLGAGTWNHYQREFNHPIGISYKKLTGKKINQFVQEEMLNKEIRLFNGNIGCGTCHNIYSDENNMLSVDNRRSRLCLECHIK